MIPASIRVLAAVRGGAHLVHRPRGVVHVHRGPLTPSGRYAAAAHRTVCGTRTRRLSVLEAPGGQLGLGGRRFCRRCTAVLPPSLGTAVQHPVTREDWALAFGHLTLDDFVTALSWSGCHRDAPLDAWAAAAAGTHTLGFLLSVVHGPQPIRRPQDPNRARLYELHAAIVTARRRFENNARTPAEREQAIRDREAEELERIRVQAGRRKEDRRAVLTDRRNRGSYLTTWERDFLASTG
jgi:hypothetical protein